MSLNLPLEHQLWGKEELSEYFRRPWKQVQEHIITIPDYTCTITMTRRSNVRMTCPLWRAIEVIEFTENFNRKGQ